jgi:CubicO group peptidase (beta-lactamase class C family)
MMRTSILAATIALTLPLGCGDDDLTGSGGSDAASSGTTLASSSSVTTTADASSSATTGGEGGQVGQGGSGGTSEGGAGGNGGGGGEPIDPRFAPLAAAVEAEIDELGAAGAAIAVIEGGRVTFARGFGEKAPGGDPVSPSTLFRIGSVNKVLTAAALLTEVEAGRVDLDAPLTDVVPEFEPAAPQGVEPTIRMRNLLSHTGAMRDYLVIDTPPTQQQDEDLDGYVTSSAFIDQAYLMAPPGAFFIYSNPNYYLAGLVAERSSELGYRELMQERVFAPLGMSRTFFLAEEVLSDGDFAIGWSTYQGLSGPIAPDAYENAWARPAGYAFSSVLDLAAFVTFLMDGDGAVLDDSLRADMSSRQVDMREVGSLLHYGYGLFIQEGLVVDGEYIPLEVVSHGGDIPGFAADILFVPSARFGLVTLANADGAHLADSQLVALETLIDLPEPATLPDLGVTDEELSEFAGAFQDDFNVGTIRVRRAGEGLEIEMPLLDEAGITYQPELEHLAAETFLLAIDGIQTAISFLRDDAGAVRYARTRFFVGIRPESALAAGAPIAGAMLDGERRHRFLTEVHRAAIDRRRPLLAIGP